MRRQEAPPGLGPAEAQLLAWLAIGVVNTAVLVATLEPTRPLVMAWHHALDAGHVALLGLASLLGVRAWQRFGQGAPWWLQLFFIAFALDGLFLAGDLVPRAGKLPLPPLVGLLAMLAAAAASVVVVALVARRFLARGLFRIVGVLIGLQLAAANHLVLMRDYPGVHLHLAWLAALIASASLGGLSWLGAWRAPQWILVALGLLAAPSLIVSPPSTVLVRALSRSGSPLVPFVSRLHAWREARAARARYGAFTDPGPIAPTEPPILPRDLRIVFVTIDCLRADVLEDESHRAKLPTLFSLRDEGVWFRMARTPAPATIVALSSIFSGRYFSGLHWSVGFDGRWGPLPHRDPTPRLPELLSAAGVETAIFSGSPWVVPETRALGQFDRHDLVLEPPPLDRRQYTSAARTTDAAIAWLDALGEGPAFAYMHWLEAHAPYDLAGEEGTSDFERYLAELALTDRALGRLRDALARDAPARSLLIVSADHGEAFGEHGNRFHGVTVYEELMRVPLLVWGAGLDARRVDVAVSLMDVMPTVLDLYGVPTPGHVAGVTLVPLLAGGALARERPIAMESGRFQRAIVFPDGYKLIHDRRRGTVELYDLAADPDESENLVDELEAQARARRELLESYFGAREYSTPGYQLPYLPP